MKKDMLIKLFMGLILVQIAVPISMIVKREITLQQGTTVLFKTAPVDPYDAFRGRYVALRVAVDPVRTPPGATLTYGQKVYAHLSLDENGFAQVSQITTERPRGRVYIGATVGNASGPTVSLFFPIDRYYMNERTAPRAERLARDQRQRTQKDAYISVKIKDGFAIVDGLYIDGERIEELIHLSLEERFTEK